MGHRVIDAIIENGQLKYVGEELPAGRIKVHLIYDTIEESVGIYPGIDAAAKAKRLRKRASPSCSMMDTTFRYRRWSLRLTS